MKKIILHVLAIAAAAGAWSSAIAEDSVRSLPRIIEYALQHNSELQALHDEKEIHEANKTRANLLLNPVLDLEAASGALTGSKHDNSLALGLSQEFSLAGKRDKRLTIAERELEIYRWQLADKKRLLCEQIKSAFYDALLAKERLALTDRFIGLNRQLLDVTKERLAAGDIPELEMNLVKVELARSDVGRIEVARTLLQSQARLWTLMALPAGGHSNIEGRLEAGTPLSESLSELKQLAYDKRPDIKALETEKSRGDADLVLAEAERIPNLTAGLIFRRDATSMTVGGIEGRETAYSIGIRLSMPIPVFDNNQAGIQEARAKMSRSKTHLVAAVRTLEQDVETAYASFQNATSVITLYTSDILPQLEENVKLTQEAYRLGEVSILTVIQEQKKFFEVNDSYLTALHDRQTALLKLESVTASELTGGEK